LLAPYQAVGNLAYHSNPRAALGYLLARKDGLADERRRLRGAASPEKPLLDSGHGTA